MGSLRPTGRFLPFTNNIQRTQKQPVPGGFPQSLSGSETDISTSNENLSNEERYVIRHTARVEPQGQENLHASSNRSSLKDAVTAGSNRNSLKDSISGGPNSNRSSLDVSSSSYNTLIIHNAGQEDTWTGRLSGIRDHTDRASRTPTPSSPYHTLLGDSKKSSCGTPPHKDHPTLPRAAPNYIDVGGQRIYTSPPEHGVQEITEIPDDYLNQSSVLKHLAKEVAQSPPPRSPRGTTPAAIPPATPAQPAPPRLPSGYLKGKLSREKLSLSRSQPDLSSLQSSCDAVENQMLQTLINNTLPPSSVGVRAVPGSSDTGNWSSEAGTDLEEDGTCFSEMLDGLAQENAQLKAQLDEAWQKIAKTQKLEDEVWKVHRAHEELVGSCERRERLERAARARLQSDCRRLHEINRALRDQVDLLSGQMLRAPEPGSDTLRKELQNREMLIAQLITQNKELACSKERQEIEIAAQRATLQEQRTHIDILDTALTNAQSNVVRLEEECRHAQGYVERVAQLQRALTSLQQASDRREQTERKLRSQLEKELHNLRTREEDGASPGGNEDARRRLREREERVLALEGECAKWEQRYLEEAALRQAAIDAAGIPKDAKIAALEKTSQDAERLMAEARSEKIRHMDELHIAQKKCADLEGRVKELESKVAERDAMIKVLQKHTQSAAYDSSASLRNNNSREELGFGASSSAASFSSQDTVPLYHHRVLAHLPPSSGNHSPKYGTTPSSPKTSASTFDSTKRSLDDELAQLDSRLDRAGVPSARGLCCFPAFGTGTAPRKGKLTKPLLSGGGPSGLFEPGFLGALVPRDTARPEEMTLLERQGRASQQQRLAEDARRSGSLPPSSLPRPPRKPSARRLGEYGRLSDAELRKKSEGDTSISSAASRGSPARSLLPAPRRLGEYGRLNEDTSSQRSLRKPTVRSGIPSIPTSSSLPTSNSRESLVKERSNSSLRDSYKGISIPANSSRESLMKGARDSGGSTTMSDNSASSLPSPSKLAMYHGARARRSSSLNKEGKITEGTINKYRIQF